MTARRPLPLWCAAILTLTCWPFAPVLAGPLAQYVPRDAGLCLELHAPANQLAAFQESDLADRWLSYEPLARWREQNGPHVQKLLAYFALQLGRSPQELWHGLFAGESALAVWPPLVGQSDGPALALIDTESEDFVRQLTEHLLRAQRASGGHVVTEEIQLGATRLPVYGMAAGAERQQVWLAVHGRLLALATQQGLLERSLQLAVDQQSADDSLARTPAYLAAQDRLPTLALARAFLNPRAWDGTLQVSTFAAETGLSPRSLLAQFWQASQFWAAAVTLGPPLRVEAAVELDAQRLAPPLASVLDCFEGDAQFLEHVPADALFALAGHVDVAQLLELAQVTAEVVQGADSSAAWPSAQLVALRLLQRLGQDGGAYLTFDAESPAERWPLEAVVGASVQPRGLAATVEQSLAQVEGLVSHAAELAAGVVNLGAEQPVAQLERTELDHGTLLALRGFPPLADDLTAAFAFRRGHMYAGTSPAAVERAATVSVDDSLAANAELARLLSAADRPSLLLYADLRAARAALEDPRAAPSLAALRGLPTPQVRHSIDELRKLLNLGDRLLCAGRLGPQGFSASLQLSGPAESAPSGGDVSSAGARR